MVVFVKHMAYIVAIRMEKEKPYLPPMTGQEVFDMFGDRRLLTLEQQHKQLDVQMKELSAQLAVAHKHPEADWEEIKKMEAELQVVRELMREHDRLIRKAANDFAKLRGPVTLH